MNLLTIQIQEDGTAVSSGGASAKGLGDIARLLEQTLAKFAGMPAPAPRPAGPPAPYVPAPPTPGRPTPAGGELRPNPDLDALFDVPAPPAPKPVPPIPAPPPAPPVPDLSDDDGWYKRYRELQNQYDRFEQEGRKLRDAELDELERLRKKLEEEANKPTPTPDLYTPQPHNPFAPAPPPGWTPPPKIGLEPINPDEFEFEGGDAPLPWWLDPHQLKEKLHDAGKADAPLPDWLSDEDRKKLDPVLQDKPKDAKPGWSGAPKAKAVWEKWTPEGAFNDLKGMLPAGLGNKMDEIGAGWKAGAAAAGAEGTSATLGAVRGALAAAGPAVALAVAKLMVDQVAGRFEKLEKTTLKVGAVLEDLAGNNHFGMFVKATDAAAEELGEIPLVGRLVSAEFRALVAPVKAYHAVTQAFVEYGKQQLSSYSGPLAVAAAMAEVRSMGSDIKEAQKYGRDYARLTDEQSRAEAAIRDILLPMKGATVKILGWTEGRITPWLERLAAHVDRGMALLEAIGEFSGAKRLFEKLEKFDQYFQDGVDGVLNLVGMGRQKEAEDAINDMLQDFGRFASRLPATPQQADPGAGARGIRFNAPIFNP